MKIDEAIERVKYTNLHCDMYEDCIFNGECGECEEALDMVVETLQWYREQDLIRREDCYASFRQASEEVCDICSTARGEVCDSCSVTEDLRIISKIPKAEYGGDDNDD